MKKSIIIILIFILTFTLIDKSNYSFNNKKNNLYNSILKAENEDLDNIQCPIPLKDRVLNKTEIQCVWASIEMLGRWAEEKKLTNPSLTSRIECQGFSTPTKTAAVLNKLNVKFEQRYGNKQQSIELIKQAMKEKRGCMWTVPGHAMVIVHYDEQKNIFKWVDNSDRNLSIQTSDIDFFNRNFDSWVLVIYSDYSIIKKKTSPKYNLEMFYGNEKINYDENYIEKPINYNLISY